MSEADEESLFPRGSGDWRAPSEEPRPTAEKTRRRVELPPADVAAPVARSAPAASSRLKAVAAWVVFAGALAIAVQPLLRPRDAAPPAPAQERPAPGVAPREKPSPDLVPLPTEAPRLAVSGPQASPGSASAPTAELTSASVLAARSSFHAAIARAIQRLEAARAKAAPDSESASRAESDFVDTVRALGAPGVPAMKETILALGDDVRLLVARALAGLDPEIALPALAELIRASREAGLRAGLLRDLPALPEAAGLVAETFDGEPDPRVRRTLLIEYSRRLFGEAGGADATAALAATAPDPRVDQALLRNAAIRDPDPAVRGAALAIVAHRGDPRDADLVKEALEHETEPGVRRAATNALARTSRRQDDLR